MTATIKRAKILRFVLLLLFSGGTLLQAFRLPIHSATFSLRSSTKTACIVRRMTDGNKEPGDDNDLKQKEDTSSASNLSVAAAQDDLQQAAALRAEANAMRTQLDQQAADRKAAKIARIDAWIDDLLFASSSSKDNSVELLYTAEQVTQRLVERRMSEEHVLAIFRRLSQLYTPEKVSRSQCHPLVELLVQAAGRMDGIDRDQQINKRWSGKVERKLQHRLFARDWNIDLDELLDQEDADLRPLPSSSSSQQPQVTEERRPGRLEEGKTTTKPKNGTK